MLLLDAEQTNHRPLRISGIPPITPWALTWSAAGFGQPVSPTASQLVRLRAGCPNPSGRQSSSPTRPNTEQRRCEARCRHGREVGQVVGGPHLHGVRGRAAHQHVPACRSGGWCGVAAATGPLSLDSPQSETCAKGVGSIARKATKASVQDTGIRTRLFRGIADGGQTQTSVAKRLSRSSHALASILSTTRSHARHASIGRGLDLGYHPLAQWR